MSSSDRLLHSVFLSSFFFTVFASSLSLSHIHKCSEQQTDALLLFKQNLSSINYTTNGLDYVCHDWLGSDYNSVMMDWNSSTDCCHWNGVTCDYSTGDVIGVDLSCGMLQGTIHPNTSLFHLPRLQRLNLAYNDFTDSHLPREIARFSNSLTHFNISGGGFSGLVPADVTHLGKLVSLDLSWNDFKLEHHVFFNLLRNSTILRQLSLGDVDISLVLPAYLNISSSLKSLNLRYTGLQGKVPRYIFNLQSLEKLDLAENTLTGHIPSEISLLPKLVSLDLSWNGDGSDYLQIQPHIFNSLLRNSTLLRDLSLADVTIGSVLPTYLNLSSSLKSLDLSSTSLRGKLPDNIFNLPYLEELELSGNYNLTGPLPQVNTSSNIPLKHLYLSSINISGGIPGSIGHLKSLKALHLSFCGLVGPLPDSLGNLRNLTSLHLSYNELNGRLPSSLFTLPSLEDIFLDHNMFRGNVPLELFSLQSLKRISLSHNQLTGQIDVLDQGPILQTFRQLTNLTELYLSFNHFRGDWELDTLLSSLTNLFDLDLSYSGLSVVVGNSNPSVKTYFSSLRLAACNLKVFPESLRTMKNLVHLDLSNNGIHGPIPDWAGEIGGYELFYLNISHNSISYLPQFQWDRLQAMYVQSNMIEGPFPPSICSMSNLRILDMSTNSFRGVIPQCLGNITSSLSMINLGNNRFQGPLPNVYEDCGGLEGLILNRNLFQGEVSSSLSKCRSLKVLDLGNNHLNGTFPVWLGDLPNLQVLVLKSNNFHGPIITSSSTLEFPFPSLQVLDMSHNGFIGQLPRKYFQNFRAMKNVAKKSTPPQYLNMSGLYYSIVVAVKGQELPFPKLLVDYIIIDLSHNRFEGEIPNIIGSLDLIIVLNLSHNNLTGRIPHELGNLLEIESLDVSCNHLIGEIPQSLADLTFLGFLNLSENHLKGRIPQRKQFNTFDRNSFGGNSGLCGLPLPKQCELLNSPQLKGNGDDDDEEEESRFTWKAVVLGYGCGTLIGLVLGYIMLSTGKPMWFNAIYDAAEHVILKRRNKRGHISIGK